MRLGLANACISRDESEIDFWRVGGMRARARRSGRPCRARGSCVDRRRSAAAPGGRAATNDTHYGEVY